MTDMNGGVLIGQRQNLLRKTRARISHMRKAGISMAGLSIARRRATRVRCPTLRSASRTLRMARLGVPA